MLTYEDSMLTIFKLINNAEVIGEVINETDELISIKNPLSINYRYKNDTSPPMIALSRYFAFSVEEVIDFKQKHVLSRSKPIGSMTGYYNITLKNIKEYIDPNVEQELVSAAGEESLSSESQAKLALIERHVTKATLN